MGALERIRQWLRSTTGGSLADEVEGEVPVATPSDDVGLGVQERETSTNAQTAGAADEPWSGSS